MSSLPLSYPLMPRLLLSATLLTSCLLAACTPPSAPAPAVRPVRQDSDIIAAIRMAGDKEKSVISVNPLRDPGVAALQDVAVNDERSGRYDEAIAKLDQALKISPDSPDLLQDRAELAIRTQDYAGAEKLAHRSWELGPRLGPLCARNWQTIVEMRLHANDDAGATSARKWVQQCHVEGIPRY
ncbi:tetratricopeptide repeat protein [Dyella silvatica]|uniref:tetratricopeptide repeat protein n=1 Tax=Dyella silvatica TaxID=2992128 RepID=UPI00225A4AAC|nr:tetratricopeptide repeat protein [Dyella silvatica]